MINIYPKFEILFRSVKQKLWFILNVNNITHLICWCHRNSKGLFSGRSVLSLPWTICKSSLFALLPARSFGWFGVNKLNLGKNFTKRLNWRRMCFLIWSIWPEKSGHPDMNCNCHWPVTSTHPNFWLFLNWNGS